MRCKIAILDDEQSQIEYLRSSVLEWSGANGYACQVSVFPSAEAFLFEYGAVGGVDILLLDIEMSGQSGIDLAKQLRRNGNHSEIIFITYNPINI